MPSSLKSLLPSPDQNLSSFANVMQKHLEKEKISFHIPGHKGFSWRKDGAFLRDSNLLEDLTELPGLDELAYPTGIIADLEKRAAKLWQTDSTLISVNGATGGIVAALIMLAKHGTHILVPRGCNRSVVHGLVLSGLQPIWFEPEWDEHWGVWGPVTIPNLEAAIGSAKGTKIAGLVITSPTYAGAITDIGSISALSKTHKIPLIVDEAWGSHLLWTQNYNQAAVNCGADIVIHSLHKTLSCPTQTGLVHITKMGTKRYGFSAAELRSSLNLIQSSSPSYFFMTATDSLVGALEQGKAQEQLKNVENLGLKLKTSLQKNSDFNIYNTASGVTPTCILLQHNHFNSQQLQEKLFAEGIFPEVIFGQGLLFCLGIGTQEKEIDILLSTLNRLQIEINSTNSAEKSFNQQSIPKPTKIVQELNPRQSFFMPSQLVPCLQAVGQVSAECRAPCPPGWPILVPGQRINEEITQFKEIETIQIVKEMN